jgi:sugar phosphate permease
VQLALKILSSGPVWAIVIVQSFSAFTAFILDDGLPSYMRDVAGLSLTQAGILASLPSLIKTVLTLTAAWAADHLRHPSRGRRWATTGRIRKLFTGAAIGPQAAMLGVVAVSTDVGSDGYQTVVLALLVLTDGLGGLRYGGGASVNHLDIAPRNAGIIQGLKNTAGQLAGYMAPILLSWLTPYPDGLSREEYEQQSGGQPPPEEWVSAMRFEWRVVFIAAALIDSVGLVAYFVMGSGRRQWWDFASVAPRTDSAPATLQSQRHLPGEASRPH